LTTRKGTHRVDVGKTHDGTVCLTTQNGRKDKVGETTQGEESTRGQNAKECQYDRSGSVIKQVHAYGALCTFLGYFFKKSAEVVAAVIRVSLPTAPHLKNNTEGIISTSFRSNHCDCLRLTSTSRRRCWMILEQSE
jgi:hypothetical protein